MAKNRHMHLRELARQNAAEYRKGERAKRTNAQQLALLDTRRGNSTRERARLSA